MSTHFVLVDYENVQPKDLDLLKVGPFKVKLFVGPHQPKISIELAASLQTLGGNAEYIVLEASGKNSLDFHIAYYVGLLSARDNTASFHIISRDKGFDPLIKHLKQKNISLQRFISIADIPGLKSKPPTVLEAQMEKAISLLSRLKASKPRTKKTLLSTLHALFKKELSEQQLNKLLDSLCKLRCVKVDGTKVTYELPSE